MGKAPRKRLRGRNRFINGFAIICLSRKGPYLKIDGTILTGVRGNPSDFTNVVVPSGVTEIGNGAFCVRYSGCDGITSITLPDTVTRIGHTTFHQCERLTSLTLSDSVTTIGESAFCDCTGIISLSLPHSLTHIGHATFRGIKFKSVFFRSPVSRGVFITWVVGNSRNRDNWQITTVKQLRNVLRLVTELALWSREVPR